VGRRYCGRDHFMFVFSNIGAARVPKIENAPGIRLSCFRSSQIAGDEPTKILRQRYPEFRRATACASLHLTVQSDLSA